MDKYLFTDGINGVKEAYSREELQSLIDSSAEPATARIWIFRTNEWITVTAFQAKQPVTAVKEPASITSQAVGIRSKQRRSWLKTPLMLLAAAGGALLIFNFTNVKWKNNGTIKTLATRPVNVPLLDLDSLVNEIEFLRGKALDKSTRSNFRLRNNWPEHILLQLQAEKETRGDHHRFFNVTVSIDNSTGLVLDKAAVRLETWKNGQPATADTLQFNHIRYDKIFVRELNSSFRCDSISVSFLSIQARAFNFCYSANEKNNSGNSNDRWFCVKGNPATR